MALQRTNNGESKSSGTQKPQTQPKCARRILITAAEGQTGRLIIELFTTDDTYASKYDKLTALVFSEQAKAVLEEFDAVKTIVYDAKNEDALVQAMSLVNTCLLIPPARKDKAKITRTLLSAAKAAKPLTAGPELAESASQALCTKTEFESIDEYVLHMSHPGVCHSRPPRLASGTPRRKSSSPNKARKSTKPSASTYLLEYYALVRAGKTNYVATTAMLAFFGHRGQEPIEFFKTYSAEFKPKTRRTMKNGGAEDATKNVPTRASGRGKGVAAAAKSADEENVDM
ncbi:uncharacterized protein TRAVEDRAFT_21922 [Trametes versicolor FP-101664 SS1]|uniref:uncharacterized protein n=1 Tax=Trametes versicolor (strain FP-101664) TaxID=717944 RepID=UPI000462211D|nr:uncharacterized protein TRAVEDRAFT_21922 [Trametes versicolor FP-101664 SS1]EIW57020.1 hypothetical protein TRAVEDRAFT_21922 [Trametes versicolor FP-101664 SS1]